MFTAIVTADTYRKLAPRTVEREKLSERLVCCKACLGRRNGGGLAGGNRSDAASAAHSTSLIPAATGRFATTISTATATTFWLASGVPMNHFVVVWDGSVVFELIDSAPFPFTSFVVPDLVASVDGTDLSFGFYQPPDFWGLDDVIVEAAAK